MSDYGLNFGFRRSDESSRSVAEGRYRTPAGSALLLGSMVEINPSAAGFLKQSASNAALISGFSGLLVQELEWDRSIYESAVGAVDSFMKGVAKPNKLAVLTSGVGTKVWFKNTPSVTRADGRVIAARTMVTLTSLAVGDKLGWDGAKWVEVDGTTITNTVMRVLTVDSTRNLVEAVLQG